MQSAKDEADPKGLIREAYLIEGISLEESRSIFLDWALSLADGMPTDRAVKILLSRHQAAPPGHPMTQVLTAALAPSPSPTRRGGRAGRVS